ncbi:MAG: carotenoid 1,2-hydratase [Myxococcota bacterium]|nr:carotenoid 1,2-hydratase [Myxococcota bacterium]
MLNTDPAEFCTLNFALHGPDGVDSWVFSEFSSADIKRSQDDFCLGETAITRTESGLHVELNARTKPFFQWGMPPQIRGSLTLTPEAEYGHIVHLDRHRRHRWFGLAPRARIRVKLTEPKVEFEGSAYHDANQGLEPLEDGFQSWQWSRAELHDGTAVLYDTIERTGDQHLSGRLYRPDGTIEEMDPPKSVTLRRGRWGVRRGTRTDADGTPTVLKTLVDAPFYTRSLIETQLRGESVISMHESVDLDRFSAGWVRFLLPWKIRQKVGR